MQLGKLPFKLLSNLLSRVDSSDPRVILGPKPGEDAAIIEFGDEYLVAKTDPITFATDLIGWYLVQINANDIAVMGATPRWLMATLLLPEGTSENACEAIFDQLLEACKALGISLVGGHTEITHDLPRPIAVGAMLGEVTKDRVVFTSGAQPGDSIVLTKGIAIEGTSLIAREASEALRAKGVSINTIKSAKELLFNPGISVVRDAFVTCNTVNVHSMHDPTEGGLATGLMEMAQAADVGLFINQSKIELFSESEELCNVLDLDPLGLIASGALLASVSSLEAPLLIRGLAQNGIKSHVIGHVTSPDHGLKIETSKGVCDLPRFKTDEFARYLASLG